MTTKSDSCFYSQILRSCWWSNNGRQYLILINCPTRQFLLMFISSLYWYLYSYGAILIAAFVCDVWNRMMKQCNVLALPNFTGGQDDRQKKTRRRKDRKTEKQKQIRWWNNACFTQPMVDKMTDKGKRQKKKRLEDKKRERQKQIRWWNNAKCSPHPTPQVDKMTERIFFMLPTPWGVKNSTHTSLKYIFKSWRCT